jgi:hypothetical protein
MLCGFCSSENPDNSSFCRKCGRIISKPMSQSTQSGQLAQAGGGIATAVAPARVASSAAAPPPPMMSAPPPPMMSTTPGVAAPGFAAPMYAPAYAVPLSPELAKLKGVGGWLMWFCIVLTILQPLFFAAEAIGNRGPLVVLIDVVLAAISIGTGIMVWRVEENAFTFLKVFFGVMAAMAVLAIIGGVSGGADARAKGEGFGAGFRILVFVGVWYSYFNKSKRVLATFGKNLNFNA